MAYLLRPAAQRALSRLKTLTLISPSLRRFYVSDPIPAAFDENLLRILRSEVTYLSDYLPPQPAPASFGPFSVEHRPGEQWVRLRSLHADEDVKVDATMFDGAAPNLPVSRRRGYEGDFRLHISLIVEISKGDGCDSVVEFMCSAWPDSVQVQKVFPILRRGGSIRPYMGRDFNDLDEKLQRELREYLEERGVDNELAEFLHEYMANKDKVELIGWLGNIKSYVEK